MVSTIAGHPKEGGYVDGSVDKVRFNRGGGGGGGGNSGGIAIDSNGNLWVAHRDRAVRLIINLEKPKGK